MLHGEASEGLDADDAHDAAGHDHDDLRLHRTITVTGRMRPTGTPWDRAVVVPVEYVWAINALPTGHLPGGDRVGPPWEPSLVPGVPVIVMRPGNVPEAYGLRARYRTTDSTAFFPAETLVDVYAVMGGAVRVVSLALVAQVLVVAAILAGLLAVLDL